MSRSIAWRRRFPIMSARRGAIPTARAFAWRCRKQVKVNTTPAAEKLFIDLLPTSWSGQPPSLPTGGHRRSGAPRPRGRSSRAQRAPGRRAAAGDRRAGARACLDAADFHPLHLRRAGQYHGVRRSHQGAADADLRRADQVRSCRCGGRAAARDRRHRYRIARRQRAGALQFPGQGRRPQLPRRRRLHARYRRRRHQAGRAERGTRRARRSAAKCGAGNHRARNSPARGGERCCRAQRQRRAAPAKPDIAPPATIAATEQPPADKPAAAPKVEAQIAAPERAAAAVAKAAPPAAAGSATRCGRRARQSSGQRRAAAAPARRQYRAARSQPSSPAKAPT